MPGWFSGRRVALVVSGLWIFGTVIALVTTLPSLKHDDFDGLNNMLQIPFAVPWILLPMGTRDHVLDAWVTVGFGLVNAGILFWWISHRTHAANSR